MQGTGDPMRFLIYGTGAVGGYLGGVLAEAGNSVVFLARSKTAAAMRVDGLRLEQNGKTRTIPASEVLTDLPAELDLGSDAAILLTVRAFDCASVAEALRSKLRRPTPVVCFLNGIGNEETLAKSIGAEQVLPATLTTAVTVRAPGIVHIERERGLGLGRGGTAERLAEVFRHAGLEVRLYTDPAAMKWSKVPTNIVANASSAILGWPVAGVMGHPGVYRLEVEALRETFRVMQRAGHRPVDLPGVRIRWLARGIFLPMWITHPWLSRAVARGRGDRRPSFHRDIGRGRSEAPWLNGAVVDHGARLGVPTPANRALLSAFLELVQGGSDASAWRDRADRLLERAREMGVPGIR
jgi:2-dehydropantoate 2-reductase